jgi:RNA:NAD 2'-phosphotransferase (TPT1/KptA family)
LIVGGSSKVWNVSEEYDQVVDMVVKMARQRGIPTVRGTRTWIRMPLVRESSQGKIVTWHVKAGETSAEILCYFLKALSNIALQFNPTSTTWLSEIIRWSALRKGDPTAVLAAKATSWGINPVPLPTHEEEIPARVVTTTHVDIEPTPTSVPSPVEEVGDAEEIPPPPPGRPGAAGRVIGKNLPMLHASDSPTDWSNRLILVDDMKRRYKNLYHHNMDHGTAVRFSKAIAYHLRHGFGLAGKPSCEIHDVVGWYPVKDIIEQISRDFRKTFTERDFMYVFTHASKSRYELFNFGNDAGRRNTTTEIFVKPASGHSVVCGPDAQMVDNPETLYGAEQELKAEQLPTGYAYHGTHSSVWETIISDRLIAGGDGRTDRMMNHLSPFPAGDPRNVGASKDNSHVSIEYDLLRFQADCKERGDPRKVYFPTNQCIVTAMDVPGEYARRVLETKRKITLWVNDKYFPTAARLRAGKPIKPSAVEPPPRELLLRGSAQELDEWHSQYKEYHDEDARKREEDAAKATGSTLKLYRPGQYSSSSSSSTSSSRPLPFLQHRTDTPDRLRPIAEKSDEEEEISVEIEKRGRWAKSTKIPEPSAKRRPESPRRDSRPPLQRRRTVTQDRPLGEFISTLLLSEPVPERPVPRDAASEVASEIAAEDIVEQEEVEVIVCPNLLCGEIHIPGTLICHRCNEVLTDEASQWLENDPLLQNMSQTFVEGENPVIDDLVAQNDPSVHVLPDGSIEANAHAIARTRNIRDIRNADAANARRRIHMIEVKKPSRATQWWSHKNKCWINAEEKRQEDFNRTMKKATNWCKEHLAYGQWHDDAGRPIRDSLWLRFMHDEEYLTQMVLRDEISEDPALQSPDVKDKAWRAARHLGVLNTILNTYLVAQAPRANAESTDTCSDHGGGDPWMFVVIALLFTFICGMVIGCLFEKGRNWLFPKKKNSNTVGCQSQTTYTWYKSTPRFKVLPDF